MNRVAGQLGRLSLSAVPRPGGFAASRPTSRGLRAQLATAAPGPPPPLFSCSASAVRSVPVEEEFVSIWAGPPAASFDDVPVADWSAVRERVHPTS